MGEWKEYKIEDICKQIFAGGDAAKYISSKHQTSLYTIPIYANSTENEGLYGYCDVAVVSSPAITIAARGAGIGFVAFRDKPFVPIVRLITLIPDDTVDDKFLYYYLKNRKLSGDGSAIPQITVPMVKKEIVRLPILEEQQRISNILSALDDKIETNRRINARLEELAQALFKSWFIDFEPFGGKMPEDWSTGLLADVLDIIKNPIKSSDVGVKPYLPIDSIPMRRLGIEDFDRSENAQSSLVEFSKNDILIGAMRVYFHRVVIAPFNGVTRTTCFVLRPKEEIMLPYLLFLCNQDSTIEYANITSKGTTMPYAVWDNGLGNMKIRIPSMEVLTTFRNVIMPLLEKIRDGYKELKNLRNLRDTLLPKLMSSEIKVG